MATRSNHALCYFGSRLGPHAEALQVEGMDFVGDRTDALSFEVPTAPVDDAYVTLQAFDVGTYGHEVLVNGDPLSGFDIPPASGWQYWMDGVTDAELVAGENTVRICRDTTSNDSFAVGNLTIHWTEPVE